MKCYAKRDIQALDKEGGHYCRHVSAMTSEKLHSKSDIAAELAWKDAEIERLKNKQKRMSGILAAAEQRARDLYNVLELTQCGDANCLAGDSVGSSHYGSHIYQYTVTIK